MTSMEELGKKLDNMGWTLTYTIDPVDGSKVVGLDWSQVAGLVADLEGAIEWEYAEFYPGGGKAEGPESWAYYGPLVRKRRRKAGPWEEVGDDR